jgi:DNA-binding response OmpR family regulator
VLREHSDRPLIVVGPDSGTLRVNTFGRGVDDYVLTPASSHDLDQKVRALVRRDRYRSNGG